MKLTHIILFLLGLFGLNQAAYSNDISGSDLCKTINTTELGEITLTLSDTKTKYKPNNNGTEVYDTEAVTCTYTQSGLSTTAPQPCSLLNNAWEGRTAGQWQKTDINIKKSYSGPTSYPSSMEERNYEIEAYSFNCSLSYEQDGINVTLRVIVD